jgi:hypothetical protein
VRHSHPHSIDTLCTLPSSYPYSNSTILTGSSDGLLRAVQLFPTKLVGVVADHGEFPIERIAVERGGEGRWVGSVGHEELLKLTDLTVFFDEGNDEENEGGEVREDDDMLKDAETSHPATEEGKGGAQSDEDSDDPRPQKRRRQKEKELLVEKKKKGRNQVDAETTFFSEL